MNRPLADDFFLLFSSFFPAKALRRQVIILVVSSIFIRPFDFAQVRLYGGLGQSLLLNDHGTWKMYLILLSQYKLTGIPHFTKYVCLTADYQNSRKILLNYFKISFWSCSNVLSLFFCSSS